jgi:4,5-dihydroxyphthalate decarboxylase
MEFSIALDLYDRHMPFFLGAVQPPAGDSMRALEVGMVPPRRHGINRHGRMLHDAEFDFAELSLVSYIIAKSRGARLSAIPVFPRRLFSQNHIWVREDSGFTKPADLRGRRVLIWAFQVTMSVLAKGDMKRDYGVDWRDITWVTQHAEEMAWTPPDGVRVERSTANKPVLDMLMDGDVDAYINPHPDRAVLEADGEVRRLFPDTVGECTAHVRRHGFLPIMHLIGVHPRIVDARPDLMRAVMAMWEEARRQSDDYYTDPSFSQIAFARQAYDAQRTLLGANLWTTGFAANRKNLQYFLDDCVDQGLLATPISPEQLFHPSVLES